jgi:hypothetical protein
MVARFWEAMDQAEVGDLVASNPENHRRMGVAPDSAWTMEIEISDVTRSILVGNPGSRYGTVYVRHPEEDGVHLMMSSLRSQVIRGVDEWRNKRLAAVDTSAVWRIEVERGATGFNLQRADTTWVLEEGAETNPNTTRALLGEMVRLDASGFHEPGDSLAALEATLTALSEAGDTLLFLEIGGGDGDRWLRVMGDSVTYKAASYRASRLLPGLEQLRRSSLPGEGE